MFFSHAARTKGNPCDSNPPKPLQPLGGKRGRARLADCFRDNISHPGGGDTFAYKYPFPVYCLSIVPFLLFVFFSAMSVQHPTCFLQDDLYTTRQMATATNCRKVSLIRTNLYPDSASTLVEDAHISHPNATSTTGTTATTANNFFQPAFFMLLFSRLIDAVIFTSAIAITAYNYWTGDLPQPAANHQALISSAPAPSRTSSSSRSKRNSYASASSPLVQVRRRMTEEWAADTLQDNDQQDSHHQHHNRASTYARPTFASMNKVNIFAILLRLTQY